MGLFNKAKKDSVNVGCLMIGEDKNVTHVSLEATGAFMLDTHNLLAYNSFPEAMGNFMVVAKGKRKYAGLTSLLYETMARPFSFRTLDWVTTVHKEDMIKDAALPEGYSRAVQRLDLAGRFDKMWTLALLAVGGFLVIALLFALQSGLFSKIIGG